MKCESKGIAARIIGNTIVVLSVFSLLVPGSIDVICIAPGSHIAIEDFNAECCASSTNSVQNIRCLDDGLKVSGNCLNCTDILISMNEVGTNPKFHDGVGSESLAEESFGDSLPASAFLHPFLQSSFYDVDVSTPADRVVPLRR